MSLPSKCLVAVFHQKLQSSGSVSGNELANMCTRDHWPVSLNEFNLTLWLSEFPSEEADLMKFPSCQDGNANFSVNNTIMIYEHIQKYMSSPGGISVWTGLGLLKFGLRGRSLNSIRIGLVSVLVISSAVV
ncbi:hypothetical protein LguiB_003293 [Lonicera macranthoides]